MGLFDRFRLGKRALTPRADNSMWTGDVTDPQLQEYFRSGGMTSGSGQVVTPESSMRVATAYRCVMLLAGAVASLPIDVVQRLDGKKTKTLDTHPVADLLKDAPNDWQTPNEFMKLIVANILLRGNFYALKVRSAGKLVGLLPLIIGGMKVSQDASGALSYEYTRNGAMITYPQKDILHIRGYSADGIHGLSVIQHAKESLGLSASTWRHAGRLFRNGAAVAGIISHPKKLLEAARDRLFEMLDAFRGADSEKSYKDLVLDEGMKYERVAMTSVDAQLLEVMELSQYDIAMFFGVPPHMLGLITKTTSFGAGIEQMSIGFVTFTLQDWLNNICQSLRRDLLLAEGDKSKLFIRMDPAPLLMGDSAARGVLYANGRQWGYFCVDDIRIKEGMEPLPDGLGQIFLSPANMVPAGSEPKPGDPTAPPSPDPGPPDPSKKAP